MADPNIPVDGEDTEVLDEGGKSILMGIIAQLGKSTDLHRVTLPTFVLEPRSMLERITDFMSHPELIVKANQIQDPEERFVAVTRYFLSGWHIKPKGVKKPYNPILGEQFRAQWSFDDGTEAFYIAEQVSHHPPISVYYYASPENNISVLGDLLPKSKFLGNSAATLMQGEIKVSFTNRPGEDYIITMPNVYARGILFGTMLMELGDVATVKCAKLDLVCNLDFKVKGFFSGSYNGLAGKIKRESTNETLYEISGKWSDEIILKKGTKKEVLFDAKAAKINPKIIAPEDQQEPNESRRLWSKLTAALKVNNQDLATAEKSKVEDAQRADTRERDERGLPHVPRYFESDGKGNFDIKLKNISSDPQEAKKQIINFLYNTPPPV
ncbi:Oxysterol-binding protein [Linnemannia elongata AG-77]|uniref:Oxysterol-binding protein n=1 Tax=Linnemannia elongata AG-77 TaxID=1314771 RepID=A0A197JV61_9FUNG|nr:Oxysterol-binding protein [Linnemannia elongata AG-77]